MIVMREILNVKQTQVHPGDPSYGWKWKAFLDDLSDRSSAAQRRQGKGNTRQGFIRAAVMLELVCAIFPRLDRAVKAPMDGYQKLNIH